MRVLELWLFIYKTGFYKDTHFNKHLKIFSMLLSIYNVIMPIEKLVLMEMFLFYLI